MTITPRSTARRLALLALAAAILLGATAALLPRAPADAQNMNWFGRWYAKVGNTPVCPEQNDVVADAGDYSTTGSTSITLHFREWGISDCGPDNVVAQTVENIAGAAYRNQWYLELRDAPGSRGSLIDGAHIDLPDNFRGRRTSGTLNRRDQTTDGNWPTLNHQDVPVRATEISFTIPDDHAGAAYLHAGIYFNSQDENEDVWEDFTFQFSRPNPTCSVLPGALETIQNRYYALNADGTRNNALWRTPQAERITADQRYCAQVLQNLQWPALTWQHDTDCSLTRLISLRRTGSEQRGADGHLHYQVQRTATFDCSHTASPTMSDRSIVPGYLIPPYETRTEATGPLIHYFWI